MLPIVLLCSGLNSWAAQSIDLQPFTVKDAIELSYTVNPTTSELIEKRPPAPILSPNGKFVLLITQRGILSSNELEATIWLFNRESISSAISTQSSVKPTPTKLVTFSAKSNTPVICDVRWLEGSERVAFLGKNKNPFQQLFVANVITKSITAITNPRAFVSAYDIRGDTIAYTTLIEARGAQKDTEEPIDVAGQSIYSLLFPARVRTEDLDEESLTIQPSILHVERNGRDLPVSFTLDGASLALFVPMLSLSPDRKSLITIVPIHKIPTGWSEYHPAFDVPYLHLRPDNKVAVADENEWKAAVPAVIDLATGTAVPLINAPTGRSLGYIFDAPTLARWSADSTHVILSNTFLPLEGSRDQKERSERSRAPAVAVVDVRTHYFEPLTFLGKAPYTERVDRRITDLCWTTSNEEVTTTYVNESDTAQEPLYATYRLMSGRWARLSVPDERGCSPQDGIVLRVYENLNRAPVLAAYHDGSTPLVLWDPNPQLARLNLSEASRYQWQDESGTKWAGIFVPPATYEPGVRYPLVIQTHGHEEKKFFADGEYTTGNGGRALAAKGIAVLQMDEPDPTTFRTPENGQSAVAGFESAIRQLSGAGLIDPRRVGVIGFSFTCFHVLFSLTHRPDLFAAASITDGNDESYIQYIMSMDAHNTFQEVGEDMNGGPPFGEGALHWAKNAPGFNLDRVRTPLLISALEKGHLLSEWEPYSGLRRLNKPVELVWLRKGNAPHVLVKPKQRYFSQQMAVDWFDFWLNGRQDRDPAKGDQYTRWRELREVRAGK